MQKLRGLLLLFIGLNTFGYDVVERFNIVEDKYKTQDMFRQNPDEWFHLDITAALNKNILDVVDDADKVSKTQGTDTEKFAAAQDILNKYDKTEQFVRVGLDAGFPIFPDFSIKGVKLSPNFNVNLNVGAMIGIRAEEVTIANILDFLAPDVDSSITTALINNYDSIPVGTDMVEYLIENDDSIPDTAETRQYVGKYFKPTSPDAPIVDSYVRGDLTAGLQVDYKKGRHYFGHARLQAKYRRDLKIKVSAEGIAKTGKIDFPEEENSTVYSVFDYRFGYKNKNLATYASIEDIPITKMSDNEAKGGVLFYDIKPLIRLHSEYTYKFIGFTLQPFAGLHKRSGYGIDDGMYIGGNVGFHTLGDRIGVNIRGQLDGEHFTFAPNIKLWLIQVEYMLKQPIKSEKDGVKVSALHGVNLRIAL